MKKMKMMIGWLYDDDEEYEEDESLHKINVCYCN